MPGRSVPDGILHDVSGLSLAGGLHGLGGLSPKLHRQPRGANLQRDALPQPIDPPPP